MKDKKDKYILWSIISAVIVVVVLGSFFIVRGVAPNDASVLNKSLNVNGGAIIVSIL